MPDTFTVLYTLFGRESDDSYCVGTRRPCILEPELIDRCRAILHVDGVQASHHDQRMVAEIFLYSKLYRLLQMAGVDRRRAPGTEDGGELQRWKDEWDYLFRTIPESLSSGCYCVGHN